jgi:NTE family protein
MSGKVALVLGGGGSRGIAHIGVLEILVREKIPIDMIVGTSMGAIVGALFALGLEPTMMAEKFMEMQSNSIFNMNLFSARARQNDLKKQLERGLRDLNFSDLQIPLFVTAVDVIHGTEVVLTEGPLIPALLASSAVPAVFPPVEHMGMHLADGGVIDSLATHIAYEQGADKIIAVDVYPPLEKDNPWVDPVSAVMGFQLPFNMFSNTQWGRVPSMMASMWRSFRVMACYLHEQRLAMYPPDVLICPAVSGYGSLDFTDVSGPLAAGRHEAKKHIHQIKSLLATQVSDESDSQRN